MTIVKGQIAQVALIMHRNGRAAIQIDFADDAIGGADGSAGAGGQGGVGGTAGDAGSDADGSAADVTTVCLSPSLPDIRAATAPPSPTAANRRWGEVAAVRWEGRRR
jgi:hypothetical protein